MFRKIFLIALLFTSILNSSFAQSPNLINYQGVAHQTNGNPISNQLIAVRLTIHTGTAYGVIQYSEARSVTTDQDGLFGMQIGSPGATNITGSWSAITWENGTKYLQVEIDTAGGTNYLNMGTQQLASVPYAQHAKQAASLMPTATINANQIIANGATSNQVLKYNGSNWVPAADVSAFALPLSNTDASSLSFKIANTNVNGTAVEGSNSSSGIAIKGTTGTGYGVFGECTGTSGTAVIGKSNGTSTNSRGVYGESASGTGVMGYGNNSGSVAVYGSALAGTGVKAYSYTGKALEVDGNVKIAGGNTNPSDGAVLTSDANGNATWRKNNISFTARNAVNTSMADGVDTKVEFSNEEHDLQNNFVPYAGATTSNSSKFTAPIAGVYSFSAAAFLFMGAGFNNFTLCSFDIMKNGTLMASSSGNPHNTIGSSFVQLFVTTNIHLNANDKVWIQAAQMNEDGTSEGFLSNTSNSFFSGYLLFAD